MSYVQKSLHFFVLSLFVCANNASTPYNINLIGHVNIAYSFSRHTTSFIECLHPDIPVILFKTYQGSPVGFPDYFDDVINQGVGLYDSKSMDEYTKANGPLTGITIYGDSVLWNGWEKYIRVPNKSTIKYAYCVTERTLVTNQDPIIGRWVNRLNTNFDALLVPDEWLIDTFKNVGIKIPIFTLPLALGLHALLKKPVATKRPKKPFHFGFSAGCWPHKNHRLLVQAFAQEFGNNPKVMLILHCRGAVGFRQLVTTVQQANVSNIKLEQKSLPRAEYENFIASLDCYVTVSKGEGFSIIPREALAAGVPCIISNNTAQTTICDSGFVYAVPSNILEPSTWVMAQRSVGFDYNCSIRDVRKALRNVYNNHEHYRNLALKGREWTRQYLPENLGQKYKTLVAPKTVMLGLHNEITDEYLMTNSKQLFERYKSLCASDATVFITT